MREDGIHRIEAHVGCICFHGEKVLLLKRTVERKLFPGLWECGGGQVRRGESFEEAVKRQLMEEAGVEVEVIGPLGTYAIDAHGERIPGVYFACRFEGYAQGEQPALSQEHSEWRWASPEEAQDMDLIPGLRQQIARALGLVNGKARRLE